MWIPLPVREAVFAFLLKLADERVLLSNQTVAVDSTLLEANAAMKCVVRRETGEDWKACVRGLTEEAGVEIEDDEDLRQFGITLKNKTVSIFDDEPKVVLFNGLIGEWTLRQYSLGKSPLR